LPVSYASNLIELVGRWGISGDALLAGSPITAADLEKPSARIPLAAMNGLVSRARALTGEPGLGFYLGLQKRISYYGFLGFAMMTAPNLRECIELAVRFTPVLTSSLSLRLDVDEERASLSLQREIDLGDVTDVVTLSLIVGLGHIASDLTGQAIEAEVEFEMPEPPYYPRFAHVMPRARFGQPATRVLFARSALDLPIVSSDRPAMVLARAECERALAELIDAAQIGGRVRRVLAARGGAASLNEVAAELGLSPRTLTRRLAAEGLSFSELVERERREQALALLRRQSLSLEEVTEQLEYSTVANFIRAFKRWTGTTPAFYRRSAMRPHDA
jgi:AraC-like DNA-binding protein